MKALALLLLLACAGCVHYPSSPDVRPPVGPLVWVNDQGQTNRVVLP